MRAAISIVMPAGAGTAAAGAGRSPDRDRDPRVRKPVRCRLAALLLAAALPLFAAPGCGGKRNVGAKEPQSSGSVMQEDTGLMQDQDPAGGLPDTGGPPGASGAKGDAAAKGDATAKEDEADRPDQASGDATAAAPEPAAPPIEPPDLDLAATDQQQRIQSHLATARAALRGPGREPDRALTEARAALKVDAGNIDAVVLMAHAYHAKDLDDTAEVVLDMVFKERPAARTSPGIYYVYGLVYDHTDRPERALLAYQKAVELDRNHKSALINLGMHYLRNRLFGDAVQVHERLTRDLGADGAAVWTNLGSAYRGHSADYPSGSPRRDELLRQAETAYKRALSLNRSYANAYYNLGLLYLDAETFPGPDGPLDMLKRLERAKTYFDEYRAMKGADIDLVADRLKQVDKLIKRETKRRKRPKSGGDDW